MALFTNEDPSIDNADRFDTYMSFLPAGAGYRNLVHYGQAVNQKSESFVRYDYGKKVNRQKYGQDKPPHYDLNAIDFPMALFGGTLDLLADPKDVDWTHSQLKKSTAIYYKQYYLGHMSFAIAKNMDFFTVDAMAILNHYNGRCDRSTLESNFEVGNKVCREYFAKQDQMDENIDSTWTGESSWGELFLNK